MSILRRRDLPYEGDMFGMFQESFSQPLRLALPPLAAAILYWGGLNARHLVPMAARRA
ncbi:MAG TPA: hypothetical protein VMG08_12545 [Allosphingosinicella sp.]|nr:hypothetical protein [Allosphingosinicella sp.]